MDYAIILVANQKGGLGKTVTVKTVAHYLHSEGVPVNVLDLDAPSSFREVGASQSLRFAKSVGIEAYTLDTLPEQVSGHLLIDAPPDAADRGLALAMEFADYLVIPSGIRKSELEVSEVFYANAPVEKKRVLFTDVPYYSQTVLNEKRCYLERLGLDSFETHIPRMAAFEHADDADTTVAALNTYPGRAALRPYITLCEELGLV